jgi:hypothetical protein
MRILSTLLGWYLKSPILIILSETEGATHITPVTRTMITRKPTRNGFNPLLARRKRLLTKRDI